jgi:intracellular sulfur oxidation DsrE/DsrF family protein
MSNTDDNQTQRRALLGSLGMAALASAAVAGSSAATAQAPASQFQPKRHVLDAWMGELPGDHRVFVDTDNVQGGTNALRYVLNIINAHVNAYEGKPEEMAAIICYRHASTVLGFTDAMWAKYGTALATMGRLPAPAEGQPPATHDKNPQTESINDMAGRGVHFAVCNSATTMMSGFIARQMQMEQAEVYADLAANLIPNARLVPAGVMAVTRAQEYGYSFLYSSAS